MYSWTLHSTCNTSNDMACVACTCRHISCSTHNPLFFLSSGLEPPRSRQGGLVDEAHGTTGSKRMEQSCYMLSIVLL